MRNKFENWEKLRAKGKWNYILKYGVLLWGGQQRGFVRSDLPF